MGNKGYNWKSVCWGDLATLEYGKGLREYKEGYDSFPVYGTNGQIGWHNEYLYPKAGVIVGRKGAYRGIHFSKKPFFVIDTAFYLKPKDEKTLDIRWAFYQLLNFDTSNPILKARYAHVLWASPRKHVQYAKQAVDFYLELVKVYEEKDKKTPKENYGIDVLDSIQTASIIGFSINYRIDDILSEMKRLVKEFNFQSSSAFVMRTRLISHMLVIKAKISPEPYKEFPQICYNLGAKFFKDGDFHSAIDLFEVGEKVDNKLGSKTHDWNRSIAESYEGLMNQRQESDLATIHFCQKAIDYYRRLKDEKKITELEKKYEQLRGKQQFQKFTQEIDLTEYGKRCREIAEKLCAEEPEKIISMLISDKGLLPKLKDMETRAEEIAKKTVFSSIAPVSITDHRGHTAEYFSTDDERRYYRILEQYAFEINLAKQFLVNEIFVKAVQTGKLDIHTVIDCFERRSWFGKNIRKGIPGGEIVTYNWLNMIAPSLNEYFNQMKAHFLEPAYAPNFVLAIDSLTLKIEGLIRDICSLSGITTFYLAKDKQGRNIVREKDINWLLRGEAIKKLFDEDDLLFFKFVLVEKAGLNLRHKIAHCLMEYSEYNITYMHLLLLVLFRLGRYDFVKPEETIEEKVADPE
jgi:hypothetical protein